tara:strand:+ start:1054 stop:1383 length:330 start_codon:yes stop_codon:yes gene_type:complete
MAQGDITKEIEYDKIEVVNTWAIQVRKATKIMEEQADGSKKELTRSFHRHVVNPFISVANKDSDGNITGWTHTATDISGEDASVQAIANAAWTDTVKNNYKAYRESQSI